MSSAAPTNALDSASVRGEAPALPAALPSWYAPPPDWPPKQLAQESETEDSDSGTDASWDSEREAAEAQAQFDESIRQLHLIFSIVALPYFAKWAGRKWAYAIFGRYQILGLGKRFWLGPLAAFAPSHWP